MSMIPVSVASVLLDGKHLRIDGHAHDSIGADGVESVDFLLGTDAACHDQLPRGQVAQARGDFNGKALQKSLAVDMRIEECGTIWFELRDSLIGRERDLG